MATDTIDADQTVRQLQEDVRMLTASNESLRSMLAEGVKIAVHTPNMGADENDGWLQWTVGATGLLVLLYGNTEPI